MVPGENESQSPPTETQPQPQPQDSQQEPQAQSQSQSQPQPQQQPPHEAGGKRRRGRRGGRREEGDGPPQRGGGGGGGGGGGAGRRDGYDAEPRRAAELRRVLEGDADAAQLDQLAEAYGQAWGNKPPWVKNRFATYQIRGIVGEVERLRRRDFTSDPEAQRMFRLLRSKVAYVARRYHDEDLYEFARVMRVAVDTVGADAARFRRFLDLFDTMLYYFRAAGGR